MPDCSLLFLLAVASLIRSSVMSEADSNQSRSPLWNATATDRLKRDLLMGYDKFARPTNPHKITPVDFNFHVTHVNIDEGKFLMTLNVFITLTWYDDKLKWDPANYDGIKKLHVADHEIWDPDVYVVNSTVGNGNTVCSVYNDGRVTRHLSAQISTRPEQEQKMTEPPVLAVGNNIGNAICFVYNDGRVTWHPPAQFSTFCELDLTKWPFDRHTCILGVGSFAYYNEVNFTAKNKPDLEFNWSVKSEWKISDISITSNNTITYGITVERYGNAYISTVILPAAALAMMTLAVFWLPSQAQERFLLSSIAAVLLSINLVFISHKLPFMGANTPVIVITTNSSKLEFGYNNLLRCSRIRLWKKRKKNSLVTFNSVHLVMAGISIIISTISFNLSTTKRQMPWYIQMIIKGPMASYLGLTICKVGYNEEGHTGEEMRGYGYDSENREEHRILDQGPPQTARMWNALAIIINRVAFLLYVIIFTGLALRAVC